MRIGVDARFLRIYRSFGRYAGELLPRLLDLDKENKYVFLGEKGDATVYQNRLGGREFEFGLLRSPVFGPKLLKDHWFFARQLSEFNLDLIFHPDNQAFYFSSTPAVVTVHDLMPLLFPVWFHRKFVYRVSYRVQLASLGKARKIIAISRSTKRDLIEYLRVDERRIEVIYQGVGPQFKVLPRAQLEWVRDEYNLPQRFILFVGGLNPHKNLHSLLRAYGILVKTRPDLAGVYLVVTAKLAGDLGVSYEQEVKEIIAEEGLKEKVLFVSTEKDSEELLIALYNLAELLAMPSFYEGFGMPPLEAMACGTPVVSSDRGSLPEVMGKAGVYFNPEDIGGMARTLIEILADSNRQSELIQAGFEQVLKFNWEVCACQTIEFFNQVVSQ